MPRRDRGLTPPKPVAGYASYCITIPESAEYFGIITGLLLTLTYHWSWRNTSYAASAMAEATRTLELWLDSPNRCGAPFCTTLENVLQQGGDTPSSFFRELVKAYADNCTPNPFYVDQILDLHNSIVTTSATSGGERICDTMLFIEYINGVPYLRETCCGGTVITHGTLGASTGTVSTVLNGELSAGDLSSTRTSATACDLATTLVPYLVRSVADMVESVHLASELGDNANKWAADTAGSFGLIGGFISGGIEFFSQVDDLQYEATMLLLNDETFMHDAQSSFLRQFSAYDGSAITRTQLLAWSAKLPLIRGVVPVSTVFASAMAIANMEAVNRNARLARGTGNTELCNELVASSGANGGGANQVAARPAWAIDAVYFQPFDAPAPEVDYLVGDFSYTLGNPAPSCGGEYTNYGGLSQMWYALTVDLPSAIIVTGITYEVSQVTLATQTYNDFTFRSNTLAMRLYDKPQADGTKAVDAGVFVLASQNVERGVKRMVYTGQSSGAVSSILLQGAYNDNAANGRQIIVDNIAVFGVIA